MPNPENHPKAFIIKGEKVGDVIVRCKPYRVKHRPPHRETVYEYIPGVDISRCPKCEVLACVVDNRRTT